MTRPDPSHLQYGAATLHIEPQALPRMRAAFDQALNVLVPHVDSMLSSAHISRNWIDDEHSDGLRTFYNARVMGADDGPYSALLKYRDLLRAIHDQLASAEAEYRRVEGENSDLWGRA